MDFDAILQRPIDRKNRIEKFNKKRQYYFNHYFQMFYKRGYDNRNKFLFDKLTQFCAYYFADINSRGLFLCKKEGEKEENTGVGKTRGVEIIGELFGINVETVAKFTDSYNDSRDKMYDRLKEPNYYGGRKPKDKIIDEVGAEKIGNDYGVKTEVFVDVLEHRYNQFIQYGAFTHFTSNLTPKEIQTRYGHRVWSRLNEMTTIIEVSGKDSRFE